MEIKATATLASKDFNGLKRFKDIAKEHFKMGVLPYDGNQTLAFGANLFAVPIRALWN